MTVATYSELLKRPEWQAKRLQVIAAAGHRCQECRRCLRGCACEKCHLNESQSAGDFVDSFEVHHRYYVRGRLPWEYPDEALVCLCRDCHEQTTFAMDVLKVLAGLLPRRELNIAIARLKEVLFGYMDRANERGEVIPIQLADLPEEVRAMFVYGRAGL